MGGVDFLMWNEGSTMPDKSFCNSMDFEDRTVLSPVGTYGLVSCFEESIDFVVIVEERV